MRVFALLALLGAAQLAAAGLPFRLPPRGPWTGSRGPREQPELFQPAPLVSQCKELWRPTRLDHFR